jgi:hypothetical protein
MKKTWNSVLAMALLVSSLFVSVLLLSGCNLSTTDTTAPKFENLTENGELAGMTVNVKDSTVDFKAGVTAKDDVDDSVTITVNMKDYDNKKVGTYVIEYTAADKAGNLAKVNRKVTVVDSLAPIFTYAENNVLPETSHLQYDEKYDLLKDNEALVVRDNYDDASTLTISVKDLGGYDCNVAGVYTVTYAVTDSNKNETTATRKVTVKESVKYVVDVMKINGESQPVMYNNENAFALDKNSGAQMRALDEMQLMDKDFYLQMVERYSDTYNKTGDKALGNGGVIWIPYCVAVVLDKDMKPVLVRNSTYAIEAVKDADGNWQVLKNGIVIKDGEEVDIHINFKDSGTVLEEGAGILGGNFESYIPDGGYVLIASAPKGGSADLGKIMVLKNLLDSDFGGGALQWAGVEANALGLLETAQFTFVQNDTTLYEKPAALATPVLTMTKHVLSWPATTGAKNYEVYIDGELKTTTTATSIKMIDLGLEPSAEGTHYNVTVKANTSDIRYYGESAMSEVYEYVMPNAVTLTAPTPTITDGVVTWDAVEGAESYEVYGKQVGMSVLLGTTTECKFNANDDTTLAKWTYNAFIYVKAVGNGVDTLDSALSGSVVHSCSTPQVITFGDGVKYDCVVTTAEDYFEQVVYDTDGHTNSRRNDSTAIGYAQKNLFFVITDPKNIQDSYVCVYSFLVVIDRDGKVKTMLSVSTGVKQFVNYEWVDAATIGYTSNGKQIAPLLATGLADGDQLIIGRPAGEFTIGDFNKLQAREVLANYYWGAASTQTAGQSWRNEHIVSEFPTYVLKNANDNQLDAPVFSVNGSVISWAPVSGATSYTVTINDTVVLEKTTNTSFNLMDYVAYIGKSGTNPVATQAVTVKVTAEAEGKTAGSANESYNIGATLTDGTTTMTVLYNLQSAFFNNGSGMNCRSNDAVSTLLDGKNYKEAVTTYASGNAKNGGIPWMTNGIAVIFDSNMKVKEVRFGFVKTVKITSLNEYITTDLVWNNGAQSDTNPGGNLKNIENEVEDTDYVLVVANNGARVQFSQAIAMFVDTNVAAVTGKTLVPNADSETKVILADKTYSLVFTVKASE